MCIILPGVQTVSRVDYVRVRFADDVGQNGAEPILALIDTRELPTALLHIGATGHSSTFLIRCTANLLYLYSNDELLTKRLNVTSHRYTAVEFMTI